MLKETVIKIKTEITNRLNELKKEGYELKKCVEFLELIDMEKHYNNYLNSLEKEEKKGEKKEND